MISFGLVACDEKTSEHEHTFSDEWSMNDNEHWYSAICEHSDEIKDKASHDLVNGICQVCGYRKNNENEHHWNTEYSSSNGQHFHSCSDVGCDEKKDIEDCFGGEATCMETAICSVCKNPYGTINPDNHDLEHHDKKEATCGSIGWNEYDDCKRGGCNYSTYVEIPATGEHKFINGVCECGAKEPPLYTRVDEDGIENSNGEYILFGYYPQTDVTENKLTLGLDEGELPTNNDFKDWTLYEYYQGNKKNEFMWYKDVKVNGYTYRAVYFSTYRAKNISDYGTANTSLQDDNGYHNYNVFWFKFEPIKWKILSEENGIVFIVSEMVLDSQAFQNTSSKVDNSNYYNNNEGIPNNIYANNYEYSTIRSWLNNDFYNIAFSDSHKNIINTTFVDNDKESTSSNKNDYICNNTNDKVFLLSAKELYDYNKSMKTSKKGTDYARVQGVRCDNRESSSNKGASYWWLRSPYNAGSLYAQSVAPFGGSQQDETNWAGNGVVPAITITIN